MALNRFVAVTGMSAALVWTFGIAAARGGPKPNGEVRLSVLLGDSAGDGVLSDGQGPYIDRNGNVRVVLMDNTAGNFGFDTNYYTRTDGGRRLKLDFGAQPSPFSIAGNIVNVDVGGNSVTVDGDRNPGDLRKMSTGQTLLRKWRLTWADTGANLQYSLRFPGTTGSPLKFTCNAADGAGCLLWTVLPTGGAQLCSVPLKGTGSELCTYQTGSYNMPFVATLYRQ